MPVKKRNILLVYLFTFISFGIYGIYWMVSTKNEMNELGAKIPTAWLLIIPIINLYWLYRYYEGFTQTAKKGSHAILWFLLHLFIGIIMPAIVQHELNKLAPQQPVQPVQKSTQKPVKQQPTSQQQPQPSK